MGVKDKKSKGKCVKSKKVTRGLKVQVAVERISAAMIEREGSAACSERKWPMGALCAHCAVASEKSPTLCPRWQCSLNCSSALQRKAIWRERDQEKEESYRWGTSVAMPAQTRWTSAD